MSNLLVILLLIFGGVALMVVVGARFGKPMESDRAQRLSRWILPLVGLSLVLSVIKHYW